MNQLDLFGEQVKVQAKKVPRGGSWNPIVFHDYESFVAKFSAQAAKTTDDCYTPPDVYEAVVRYVSTVIPMDGRQILRPFYPGGDYINAEYPDDGVVIDNPPFSIFTKVVRFYTENRIPFFIFGNGLTIMQCCKFCTAVITGEDITFHNGAKLKINFASNLFGDLIATTAPELAAAIAECKSQKRPSKKLPKYVYPPELVSTSMMQTAAANGRHLAIRRSEAEIVNNLDGHPKCLYGSHLLVAREAAERAREAAERARAREIRISLSQRELAIVEKLSAKDAARCAATTDPSGEMRTASGRTATTGTKTRDAQTNARTINQMPSVSAR